MTRRESIIEKLDSAVGIKYLGQDYIITHRDIILEDIPEDEEPSVSVILPYSGHNGMWLEHDIFLDDMLADPNLKLYTFTELPIGAN